MKKIFAFVIGMSLCVTAGAQTIIVHKSDNSVLRLPASEVKYIDFTVVKAVDLGLSSGLKWANMNVGANSPEDFGDYFAWGETEPKGKYDWSTYKFCNGSYKTLKKYSTTTDLGTADNKTVLDAEDDAAHVNWGGTWRMPTYEELNELKTECTWQLTTLNGVEGYEVTGPNGNHIFLPAAGYRYDDKFTLVGTNSVYWSSSLNTGVSNRVWDLYFNSSVHGMSGDNRCYGQSVRPVTE